MKSPLKIALILCLGFVSTVLGQGAASSAGPGQYLVFIGTYTGAKSKGIYVCRLEMATGKLTAPELAAEITSPSFVAVHPNRRFLYSVNEINKLGDKPGGGVSAFAIDAQTGKLSLLNQQSSGGAGPCHVVVDRSGQVVLAANYSGGSVVALPVQQDGRLGEATSFIQHTGSSVNLQRQKEPHAHSINVDAGNRFAVAADLGLDKLLVYKLDAIKGALVANEPAFAQVAPGSGPRHFAFHPNGRNAYVINEILCTVTAFNYNSRRGELNELQTISSLPPGQEVQRGYSTAEVQVHPSGRFVFGSNRGHDSIVVFSVDDKTGRLTHVANTPTQGKTPRNFGIDPTGSYLLAANQSSDSIVVFRIDPQTGRLTPTGQTVEVGAPVCVKFVAAR